MAGRPPLPVGSYGKISTQKFGNGYQARCRFRDPDGQARLVSATGDTKGAAERNLRVTLADRCASMQNTLTGNSRFATAAEQWFEQIANSVIAEVRSPSPDQVPGPV